MRRSRLHADELSIVVSILSLMVPAIYMFHRSFETNAFRAERAVEATEGMRAFSEELRADLQTFHLAEGDGLNLDGACGKVRYAIEKAALVRDGGAGCGGKRALARSVSGLQRTGNLLEVTFSAPVGGVRSETTTFRMGLATR